MEIQVCLFVAKDAIIAFVCPGLFIERDTPSYISRCCQGKQGRIILSLKAFINKIFPQPSDEHDQSF